MLQSFFLSFGLIGSRNRRLIIQKKYAQTNIRTVRCGLRAFRFDVSQTASLYLKLKRRQPLAADTCVLEFDYICPDYIVFFRVVVGNDSIYVRNVDPANRWTPFCIDLSGCERFLRDNMTRYYNNTIQFHVVPFPTASGTVCQLRNIRLRSHTKQEKDRLAYKRHCLERETASTDLNNYYFNQIFPCAIHSVEVMEKEIRIEGTTRSIGTDLYLCEIPMFSNISCNNLRTLHKIKVLNGTFSVVVDRLTDKYGKTYDRLYSRWFLACKSPSGYTICSYGRYADSQVSVHRFMLPEIRTKKGIGSFHETSFESDLDELDISYMTINIYLNDYIRLKPEPGTIPFDYNGVTYYTVNKEIEKYDHLMLSAFKRNIRVAVILLIRTEQQSPNKQVGLMLEYPEMNPAGAYSMPNMTTNDSLHLYAAAVDFLASRYNRPDEKYGRIHYWIAHNEVDSGQAWTNAGNKKLPEFLELYMKSMRLIYYTARKYDADAQVLVSLTHYWKSRHGEPNCYEPAVLMELLLHYCRIEGDFHWGIAHHPYAENLHDPKSWLDAHAVFNMNTQYITFKNLEVLDAWINRPEMLYKGEKRTLLLSEQNPNSVDYSQEALDEQAACLAYAMKKVQALPGIDAYIAHSWHDEHFEGGLKTGLRKYPDDPNDPYGKKRSWFVFRDAGTIQEEKTFEFAKAIIGIENWNEIFQKVETATIDR